MQIIVRKKQTIFCNFKKKPMASSFSITEHIPVSAHVYKFLLKKCGSDTYTASRDSIIGHIIINSLQRHKDLKPKKNTFSHVFNVIIKERSLLVNGIFLSIKSGEVFNSMIDKMFREELFSFLTLSKDYNSEMYTKSISKFLNAYDITEDDIKFESLYRDFRRKQKNK